MKKIQKNSHDQFLTTKKYFISIRDSIKKFGELDYNNFQICNKIDIEFTNDGFYDKYRSKTYKFIENKPKFD